MAAPEPTYVRQFRGLVTNADPRDLQPEAAQVIHNVQHLKNGVLTARKGLKRDTDFTGATTNDLRALYTFQRPEGDMIVSQDAAGAVKSRKGGTVTSRGTGYSTFWPMHFARDRFGELLGLNGINAPFRWDGLTTSVELAGMAAPSAAPSVTLQAGSGTTTYTVAIRYIDDTIPDYKPSSLSALTTINSAAAGTGNTFRWPNVASPYTRAYRVEFWRSLADDANVLYLVHTQTFAAGTYDETLTDAVLELRTSLNVTNADGTPSGYQHTPPPDNASVAVSFQDRMVYAVPVEYNEGTIALSSTTVTGSSTNFTAQMVGRYLYAAGEPAPLVISAYSSATSLTLSSAASQTGAMSSYAIVPPPDEWNLLKISQVDKYESVPNFNDLLVQANTGDADRLVGLMPFGAHLYAIKQRHLYRVTWIRQPQFDGNITLVCRRGCVNNRCATYFDDYPYFLDQQGIYRIEGGAPVPMSEQIQDLWHDATLDFSNTKYWSAAVDHEQQRIRWYVSYSGDSGTLPTRWLELDVVTGDWFTGSSTLGGFAGGVIFHKSGRARSIVGGQYDQLFLANEGLSDGIATGVDGTATAASSTTLTDSTASFGATDAMKYYPIAIVAGTGKGQIRQISASTGTQVTVSSAWTTTPDTTSIYAIGAIEWTWRSKLFGFTPSEEAIEYKFGIEYIPPTGDEGQSIDVRRYFDNSSTANTSPLVPVALGDRFSIAVSDSDAVLNAYGENGVPGYAQLLDKRIYRPRFHGNRAIAYELHGFAWSTEISILGLDIEGYR